MRPAAFVLGTLGIVAAGAAALGANPVLRWIDAHAPGPGPSTLVHIEKQVLHMEARAPEGEAPSVVFLGSSSVVNGVDAELIRARWAACGVPWRAENFGATSFFAYELPFVARLWDRPGAVPVYLYNSFSFGDEVRREALPIRWDTREAYSLLGPSRFVAVREEVARGWAGEWIALLRYGDLYRDVAWRAITGRLERVGSRRDYPDDDVTTLDPHAPPPPVDPDLRRAYEDSASGAETLGWRGMRRFVERARAAGRPIAVGAVPEPTFLRRGGADARAVRARMDTLSRDLSVPVLAAPDAIEATAGHFRDTVHLNARGRLIYSRALAAEVARALASPLGVAPEALACLSAP